MIVTFYSYKGGVGRSMALANVAKWFEQQGLRVTMIDWDLEAPGLESFFAADRDRETIRGRLGLVDLLATYKDLFRSLPKRTTRAAAGTDTVRESFATVLSGALPPLGQLLTPLHRVTDAPPGAGSLSLLPAGSRTGERFDTYAELVQTFDWAEFYAEYDGEAYFEWMRNELLDRDVADIVLIDSRTGVAEMSGVCTRQLADVVVSFCAPNDQNLQGVAMMARSFVRADVIEARNGRPIEQLMVGSRIDLSEGKPVDHFEARFREQLNGYLPEALQRAGTDFNRLRIPYISAYAYSERLAVGEPEGVKALQDAYELLAVHIALLAPAGSTVRQKCSAAFQRLFGFPRVFVTTVDTLASEHVAALVTRLEEAGILAVRADSVAGTGTLPSESTGGQPSAVVLVVTPRALDDRRTRDTWRQLRTHGVPTYMLSVDSPSGLTLPAGFGRAEILNVERDFDRLASTLQGRAVISRVPFLAPPPPAQLVGRDAELRDLKRMIGADPAPAVALVSLGGGGKTSLAKALCNDDEIVDLFPDGVLWVTLGPQPDLRECAAKLVVAFEGESAVALDLDEAERRLAEHLKRRCCLLVLDDVCDTAVLERFQRGQRCALLLTTRLADVCAAAGAARFDVGGLSPWEATEVLAAGLETSTDLQRFSLQPLSEVLGRTPAALRLANTVLRADVARGATAAQAIRSLLLQLEGHGLDALGNDWPEALAGFTFALERLSADDRGAFPQLARLQAGVPIPIDEVPIADAGARVKRYASVSLVSFDARAEVVTVPALTYFFARTLALRDERAEETRRASEAPAGFKIYLSYRRRDSEAYAGWLSDRLVGAFGSGSVFRDVSSIALGMDWSSAIRRAVEEANVVIVLIGRHWTSGDPTDFVRAEVAYALQREIPVIPVLVDGASMPTPGDIPENLAPLLHRNALTLSSTNFEQDTDRLIHAITHYRGAASRPTMRQPPIPEAALARKRLARRRLFATAAGLASLAVGLGTYVYRLEKARNSPQAELLFLQAEDSYYGRKEPRDFARALTLYTEAADLGDASAQNALGRMYENGEGTQADISSALRWYTDAAKQNHPDALAALKRLQAPK